MSGQWQLDFNGGRIALNYTPLFLRMDKLGLSSEDWNAMFTDIRVIEDAVKKATKPPPKTGTN